MTILSIPVCDMETRKYTRNCKHDGQTHLDKGKILQPHYLKVTQTYKEIFVIYADKTDSIYGEIKIYEMNMKVFAGG